eukprot:Sspe_Gene.3692::Locus_1229_Transcript_1_1_Confidence_1.000_Length_6310::g.3692::m.3692
MEPCGTTVPTVWMFGQCPPRTSDDDAADERQRWCSSDAKCQEQGDTLSVCKCNRCECRTAGYANPISDGGTVIYGSCTNSSFVDKGRKVVIKGKFEGNCSEFLDPQSEKRQRFEEVVSEVLGVCGNTISIECGSVIFNIDGEFSSDRFADMTPDKLQNMLNDAVQADTVLKDVLKSGVSSATLRT